MSDIDLDALEAIERAMTPGEWVQGFVNGQCHKRHSHGYDHDPCVYDYTIDAGSPWSREQVAVPPNITLIGTDDHGPVLSEANAAGIVAMRNAFPLLLAEVRALREERAERDAAAMERP